MKSTTDMELDLTIDPNQLDRNWVEQPTLYFRYAVELADSKRTLDKAKTDLELVKAELDLAIRADPGSYDLPKVTEAAITSTIPSQLACRIAQKHFLNAKHEVDVLTAAVNALDHRKQALQAMVQLTLANYYSSPKAPEGAKDRMDEVEKRAIRQHGRRRKPQ